MDHAVLIQNGSAERGRRSIIYLEELAAHVVRQAIMSWSLATSWQLQSARYRPRRHNRGEAAAPFDQPTMRHRLMTKNGTQVV
jgi:hypothetical protein